MNANYVLVKTTPTETKVIGQSTNFDCLRQLMHEQVAERLKSFGNIEFINCVVDNADIDSLKTELKRLKGSFDELGYAVETLLIYSEVNRKELENVGNEHGNIIYKKNQAVVVLNDYEIRWNIFPINRVPIFGED